MKTPYVDEEALPLQGLGVCLGTRVLEKDFERTVHGGRNCAAIDYQYTFRTAVAGIGKSGRRGKEKNAAEGNIHQGRRGVEERGTKQDNTLQPSRHLSFFNAIQQT